MISSKLLLGKGQSGDTFLLEREFYHKLMLGNIN